MSQNPRLEPSSSRVRHRHVPSVVTNASGIASSAISVDTVTTLSAFPEPPASVPASPISTRYATRTPVSERGSPLVDSSRRGPSRLPDTSQTALPLSHTPPRSPASSHAAPSSYRAHTDRSKSSPYHWHEGASSIDVDPTEDIMLPTSFITDLLQRERNWKDPYPSSVRDGASSLISQMSYPPVANDVPPVPPMPSDLRRTSPPPLRPQGSRPPPSSFLPSQRSNRLSGAPSGDSETLLSTIAEGKLGYLDQGGYTNHGQEKLSPLYGKEMSELSGFGNSDGSPLGRADSSAPFLRDGYQDRANQPRQQSSYSIAPSFISRVSTKSRSIRSIRKAFQWIRKPLPPVPTLPHIPIADEQMHKKEDEALPFSALAGRSQALSNMLDQGRHPHYSVDSSYAVVNRNPRAGNQDFAPPGPSYTYDRPVGQPPAITSGANKRRRKIRILPTETPEQKRRAIKIMAAAGLLAAIIIIAVVVGILVSHKQKSSGSATCSSPNITGADCTLDATCVCTSSTSGSCDALAQSLVDLMPTMNGIFDTNFTANSLSNAIFQAIGTPTESNCAAQAQLIDVAPALSNATFPNRTTWTQSALLWNVVMTQNSTSANTLQGFVKGTNWDTLGQDGPITSLAYDLSTTVGGYSFNFGNETITQTPVSFVTDGQPTSSQISQVSTDLQSTLDRMYSYASASSTQQQSALEQYWRSTLQQDPSKLASFTSLFGASPILVPFDATLAIAGTALSSLMSASTSAPFPPPLACYPGLNSSQTQMINTMETSMFGLQPMSDASNFNPSCYPNRPVYGVLDVPRLRLPFSDSRTGVAKQAAVLNSAVSPRAVIYNGEVLSALPNLPLNSTVAAFQANPRLAGTTNHLNHIVLSYLSSISDINIANALIAQVLTNSAIPPGNTTALYQSLSALPTIEVAVFGSITPTDIEYIVSSFSSPSGSLFFGTDQSNALRNWTITGCSAYVDWAPSTGAPEVVHDSSFSNVNFNNVFQAAYNFTHSQDPGVTVTASNVTQSFQAVGLLVPT